MTNRLKWHFPHPDVLHRRKAVKGIAVSKAMLDAAQSSYDSWEEYGISDEDMAKALRAALDTFAERGEA